MQYLFGIWAFEQCPGSMANEWLRSHRKTDVYGYLKATYSVNKDLDISLRSQITTWNQTRTESSAFYQSGMTMFHGIVSGWYGDYRVDKRNLLENNTDLMVNFNKKLGNWNVSALGGASDETLPI